MKNSISILSFIREIHGERSNWLLGTKPTPDSRTDQIKKAALLPIFIKRLYTNSVTNASKTVQAML